MSTKNTVIWSLILIAVAVVAGLAFWNQLPNSMASHWNVNDQADGYMSKFWGVLMMPLITLGMLALFLVIPNLDPLKANIAQFRREFNLFIAFIVAFLLYAHGLTLAWNLGYQNFKMGAAMLSPLGVLFILIGWMLRKVKRNWFVGIRTPWTLSSDSVWDKTHQLGSTLFMLAGGLALLGSFIGGAFAFWLLIVPLIVFVIGLVVYSYILYRAETRS
ncbi:MAG: SdpI family protein [Anaerolineales bacterium]|nr:SdpI family protein [Anaerolineales bacterium]